MKSCTNKTIIMINRSLNIGGVQRKMADVAAYISSHAHYKDCRVYLLLDEKPSEEYTKGPFYEAIRKTGVQIEAKPQMRLLRLQFPFLLFLLKKILTLRPDVILAYYRRFAIFSISAKYLLFWRKMKVIVSDDTFPSLSLSMDSKNYFQEKITANLIRALYPKAEKIISPSRAARDDLAWNFHIMSGNLVINTNWVASRPLRSNVLKKYDIIYSGRVSREKNLTLLIEVIRCVCEKLPDLRVCFVGDGSDLQLIQLITEMYDLSGNIFFQGTQNDVSPFYRKSKIFCLTSVYEGLPIAPLEAMAYGLPVITTAYPGSEELIREGITGHICHTELEYADKVTRLLADDSRRIQMGQDAREYVVKYHGKENLKKYVVDVFGS